MEPHKHQLKVWQSRKHTKKFTIRCEGCGKERDYRKKRIYQIIGGGKVRRLDLF